MMSELITDRNYRDVIEAREIIEAMLYNRASEEQKTLYFEGLRGCWGAPDIQRIHKSIRRIEKRLKRRGKVFARESIVINPTSIMNITDINALLNEIKKIIQVYYVLPETPHVPDAEGQMTVLKANNIEKILFDIDFLLDCEEKSYKYAGTMHSGGGPL